MLFCLCCTGSCYNRFIYILYCALCSRLCNSAECFALLYVISTSDSQPPTSDVLVHDNPLDRLVITFLPTNYNYAVCFFHYSLYVGDYLLLHKNQGYLASHTLFPCPGK